jgi:hypothetical protein
MFFLYVFAITQTGTLYGFAPTFDRGFNPPYESGTGKAVARPKHRICGNSSIPVPCRLPLAAHSVGHTAGFVRDCNPHHVCDDDCSEIA